MRISILKVAVLALVLLLVWADVTQAGCFRNRRARRGGCGGGDCSAQFQPAGGYYAPAPQVCPCGPGCPCGPAQSFRPWVPNAVPAQLPAGCPGGACPGGVCRPGVQFVR